MKIFININIKIKILRLFIFINYIYINNLDNDDIYTHLTNNAI